MRPAHEAVLLDETLAWLLGEPARDRAGDYVDATFGRGGHSRALLRALPRASRLLAVDRDGEAHAAAIELAGIDTRVIAARGSFAELATLLVATGMTHLRGAIMDLGVSSPQLDDPGRGFSFSADGPLDMRMDQSQTLTAGDWLNAAPQADIARVLRDYGEERHARRIARAIVAARPLATTADLVRVTRAAQPERPGGKHAATRTFQAVRMHVNAELEQLRAGLDALFGALGIGGRLAVISFHSLEDRIVKRTFRAWARPPELPRRLPVRHFEATAPARLVAGPVRPGAVEAARNPRARSATLRVLERVA